MTNSFQVQIAEFSTLQRIEGAWKSADYTSLLNAMEYGDCSDLGELELHPMCLMMLKDQEPEEAAYFVLKHVFDDALREGQLRNMANEMREEKLWEEYVDPAYHGQLFTVGCLLYEAIPEVFPKPDAVRVKLEVTATEIIAENLLLPSPNLSLLIRILGDGMDDHAVLRRLFNDQLQGNSFPNANEIIWSAKAERISEVAFLVEAVSSGYWFDPIKQTESYESSAYADSVPED